MADEGIYGILQGHLDTLVLWLEEKKEKPKTLRLSKLLIQNAEHFLDLSSKTASTPNAIVYYAQGFLSLLNIVSAVEKQPWKEFSKDMLNAISFFKQALKCAKSQKKINYRFLLVGFIRR